MRLSKVAERLSRIVAHDSATFLGFVLALAIRLALLPWFSDPFNFWGFHLTVSFLESGHNPWSLISADPELARLNPWGYPALYLLPIWLADFFSRGNGFVFGLLVRIPLLAADLATGLFLFRIGQLAGLGVHKARVLCFCFLFNPYAILISTIWGTNDPLPVACVAGAGYFILRTPGKQDISALLLGLGVAVKLYPVVFIPLVLAALPAWRPRLRYSLLALAPPTVSSATILAASLSQYLAALGSFTVTTTTTGADQNFLYALAAATGISSLGLMTIAATGFSLFAGWQSWLVAKRGVPLLTASAAVVIAIFVVAPRYGQNYYIWTLPFILLMSSQRAWPRPISLLATLSWLPLAADAFIYNGLQGVTGLSYWTLISVGNPVSTWAWFPSLTHRALQAAFFCILVISLLVLCLPKRKDRPESTRPPARKQTPAFSPAVHKLAVAILASGIAIFIVSSAIMNARHYPVGPEDFGGYEIGNNRTTSTTDFRPPILDFSWSFFGEGQFDLLSNPARLVLDTDGVGHAAWVQRPLPNVTVVASLTASVDRVDGAPGALLVLSFPGGSVNVENVSTSSVPAFMLRCHDNTTGVETDLGSVEIGVQFGINFSVAHSGAAVQYRGATALTGPSPASVEIAFGQSTRFANGGGRLSVTRIQLTWPNEFVGSPLFSALTVFLVIATSCAPPSLWVRSLRLRRVT